MAVDYSCGQEAVRRVVSGPEPCGDGRTPLQVAFARFDGEWKGLEEEVQVLVERLGPVLGPERPGKDGPAVTGRSVTGGSDLVQHVERKSDLVVALGLRVREVRMRLEV